MRAGLFVAGNALEPLNHGEHDTHRNQADDDEDTPALPQRHIVVHDGTDGQQNVTNGCGTQPQTLAQAEHGLGGNLGHEGQAQR